MEYTLEEADGTRWFSSPLLWAGDGPVHAFGARPAGGGVPAGAAELLGALGRPDAAPLPLRQVHGADVARADRADSFPVEADGCATDRPGLAPSVRTADCVPVLLWDPEGGAAAAVHAGWKGTLAGVVEAGVRALAHGFRARPETLRVAIGPSIGPCCYEVGLEVASRFARRHLRPGKSDRPHLDLWEAVRDRLCRSGVAEGRIAPARLCTACHPEWFPSFRRDGGTSERMVSLILPTGG